MTLVMGLGGSGTRILAEVINILGIPIGNSLNGSNDNLSTSLDSFPSQVKDDPYNTDGYQAFSEHLKSVLSSSRSGYRDASVFCIKNPLNVHLLHHYINFCEEENYDLKVFYIIRDGRYIFRRPTFSSSHFRRFKDRFTYKQEEKLQPLEFWYHINKEATDLLSSASVNCLILTYDNMKADPESTIKLMCKKLNIDYVAHQLKFKELIKSVLSFKPSGKKIPDSELSAETLNYIKQMDSRKNCKY